MKQAGVISTTILSLLFGATLLATAQQDQQGPGKDRGNSKPAQQSQQARPSQPTQQAQPAQPIPTETAGAATPANASRPTGTSTADC